MKFKIFTFILVVILSIFYSLLNYNNIVFIICLSLMIILFYGYIINKSHFNFKRKDMILISALCSIILCIFSSEKLIGQYQSDQLQIKNISSNSILLDSIYLDGKKVKINYPYDKGVDSIHDASFITEYKIQNKNTEKYKATLKPNDSYVLNIRRIKKVEIQFQRKTSSYNVSIHDKVITIDPFHYNILPKNAIKMGNYNNRYIFDNYHIHYQRISTWFILLLLFVVNFNLIHLSFKNRKYQSLFLLVNLLEFNPIGNIDISIKLVVYILFLLILKKQKVKCTPFNKKHQILYLVSSLYISFSILGSYMIDDMNVRNLLLFILLTIFLYCIFPIFMHLIDLFHNQQKKNLSKVTHHLFFHRIMVFCIPFVILLFYQFLFSPYIYLADSTMQVVDIKNHVLSNWHPYLHTLLLKLFYQLFGNFSSFIYFRIIIYSLLLNKILFYFYSKKMKLFYVYLISILFSIMPTTGIIVVTLLKDVDFVIALIALSFYIYLVFHDFAFFDRYRLHYLFIYLSLIGVSFFRHNGIFVSILVAGLLLILSVRKKKRLLMVTVLLFFVSSLIITGPLYRKLKVKSAPKNFNIATMIHGLAYIMVENPKEFSNETYLYLTNNILSLEEFTFYYDRYNIDLLLHYNTELENKKIRNLKINQKKLISLYLKQILKSPIYLLKDRLWGTDILWDVKEDDKINTLKYQTLYDEFDINYKRIENLDSNDNKIVSHILSFLSNSSLFNILFFKAGFYLDILIIFIDYQIVKKRKKCLISLFPLFINLTTLFIAMHYQAFRYAWMISGVTLLFILLTIFDTDKIRNC